VSLWRLRASVSNRAAVAHIYRERIVAFGESIGPGCRLLLDALLSRIFRSTQNRFTGDLALTGF
jgi:polysaccharide pyruvyl transferase WcaK-like protein